MELALSLSLLVGAGVLARTLWKLTSVDPGFKAEGVMTMEIVLPRAKYPEASQRVAFFDGVLEQLASNPVVDAAGGATNLPLSDTNMTFGFYRQDMVPGRDAPLSANFRGVTPDYFRALGIPLRRGRPFSADDRVGSAAGHYHQRRDGGTLLADCRPHRPADNRDTGGKIVWREIVGGSWVTSDMTHCASPRPEMYIRIRMTRLHSCGLRYGRASARRRSRAPCARPSGPSIAINP